jgi:putative membrane protein
MNLAFFFASIHLLTFALGISACWSRADAFKKINDNSGLRDVYWADGHQALTALLWLATGLWRAFGRIEKGTDYYLHNHLLLTRMALFLVVFTLKIKPMITLIRWRVMQKKMRPLIFRWHASWRSSRTYSLVLPS